MNMGCFLLAAALLLVSWRSAGATVLILVGVPGDHLSYVLGADSKVVNGDNEAQAPRCKIEAYGNTVAVFAGATSGPSFDLRSIARPILKRDDLDLASKEALFYKEVMSHSEFQDSLLSLKQIMSWSFIRSDQIVSRSNNAHFIMSRSAQVGSPRFHVMGITGAAAKILKPYPNGVKNEKEAISLVRQVLDASAKQERLYVGKPFSIVHITSSGLDWVERGLCTGDIGGSTAHGTHKQ